MGVRCLSPDNCGAAQGRAGLQPPAGGLLLPEPPTEFDTIRDFRKFAVGVPHEWSVALQAEFRRAHWQRDALLEIAELDQEEPAGLWRLSKVDNDRALAANARTRLRAHALHRPPTPSASEYDHLNYWTSAVEECGVLVMTTEGGRVNIDEARAFSLYFPAVPVIMLNGTNSPRGRLFSLIHEFAHLALRTEGICDVSTDTHPTTDARRIEARCNALAAEVLMPADLVRSPPFVIDHEGTWSLADLIEVARAFGTSAEAMLRRLLTLGFATPAEYQAFRNDNSGPVSKKQSGKGNANYTKVRDLGKGYVRAVTQAHERSLIDTSTAATYLDARVERIPKLARIARGGS